MSSIFERMKAKIEEHEVPVVAQVFDTEEQKGEQQEGVNQVIMTQPVIAAKVIKQNLPGTPVMGFTMEILAKELGVVLEKEMHKTGLSSISAEELGVFFKLGLVPPNFELVRDEYIEQDFYILKTANRMTEIYKSLVKALGSSSSEIISFPYVVENKISLPIRYNQERQDFEQQEIKINSLYLTPREIQNLTYKFITEIQYCPQNKEVEGSIDLIAMKIDREEWKAAPYRID